MENQFTSLNLLSDISPERLVHRHFTIAAAADVRDQTMKFFSI